MNRDVYGHLMAWELRHTLRRAPFWAMLVLGAAAPVVIAAYWAYRAHFDPNPYSHPMPPKPGDLLDLGVLGTAQVLTLSLLVSSWIVLSVKRFVAQDVSDDWLLVITFRQALAARYAAGAVVGLLLALANIAAALLAVCFLVPNHAAAVAEHLEPIVLLSLLQPLAVASVLVGAADFLLAPAASVLFIQLFAAAVWTIIPVAGYWWSASLCVETLENGLSSTAMQYVLMSSVVCGLLAWWGWQRSEDFWLMAPGERRRKGYDASVGEVRGVLKSAGGPKQGVDRRAAMRTRARLHRLRVAPWIAHDLARYRWWNVPRGSFALGRLLQAAVVVAPVALAYAAYVMSGDKRQHVGLYWGYFLWWALAAGTVLRALAGGVQIVMAEREQGTLPNLVVSPLGMRRVLNAKLGAVVLQTAPSIILLFELLPRLGIRAGSWYPLPIAVGAAMAGVLAASMTRNRLMATLLAALMTVPLFGCMVYGSVRVGAWIVITKWTLCGESNWWEPDLTWAEPARELGMLLTAFVLRQMLRPFAAAALRRASADRRV
jgi:hypothetical protein